MPEIYLGDKSFSINSFKCKGPSTLTEFGFRNIEQGPISESLFERGGEVVKFFNMVANDREYTLATTQFFWTKSNSGNEVVFIKTPIGDSENNRSALLMISADTKLRTYIQDQFTQNPTRVSLKKLIADLLKANGNTVEESKVFVSTIAYMTEPANDMILEATHQRQTAFDPSIGQQFADQIEIRQLPHYSSLEVREHSDHIVPTQLPIQTLESEMLTTRINYMERQRVSPVETKDEQVLLEIDSNTNDRHVGGKFRGEVVVHGQKLTPADYNLSGFDDYAMHPSEGVGGNLYKYVSKYDPTLRMAGFLVASYEDARSDRENTSNEYRKTPPELKFGDCLNIAHIQDPVDTNRTQIIIQTPNTDYDYKTRPTWFTQLSCSMSNQMWEKLESLIRENPANAERFVQIAFAGIDDSTWRIPVDRVSIIDIDRYIPMSSLNGSKITGNLDFAMRELARKKLINTSAVETYHYPNKLPLLAK